MKVSRGLVLFTTIFISLAVMNCQWVKSCAAPPHEFYNYVMWCWTVSAAILLYLPYVLMKKAWPSLLLVSLSYIIFWANLAYLRTFGSWIPLGSYLHAVNLSDFSGSVWNSFETVDVAIPIILIVSVLLLRHVSATPVVWTRLIAFSILSIVLTVSMFAHPDSLAEQLDALKMCHNEHALAVSRFSLPVVLANSIKDVPTITNDKLEDVQQAMDRKLRLREHSAVPKNLVVIFMESLESWPVGLKIGNCEITPFLNSITQVPSTLFAPKVKNQTGAGRSIDAQLLVVCGLLPPHGLIFSFHYPGNNYPTIYKAMKEQNQADVFSFTTDRSDIYNIGKLSKQFGVDSLFVFRDSDGRRRPGDADFFKSAIFTIENGQLWDANKSKCMQFVTYSCHAPFTFPGSELSEMPLDEDMDRSLRAYIKAVHYSDYALSILIEYLQTKPDYDQTMIVIIGDHTAFGKEKRKDFAQDIPQVVEVYVPLFILNAPSEYCMNLGNDPIEQVDVYTTIIRLMGLENYGWHGLGQAVLERPDTMNYDKEHVSELILAHNLYRKTNKKNI